MKHVLMLLVAWVLTVGPATAGTITLEDPTGDDNGPGSYTYPTDPVYKKGSFDFKKVEIKDKGDKLQIKLHLKVKLEDPWKSRDWPTRGNGYSLQMAFLFIDSDHKAGSGHKDGVPGLNVQFKEDARWEKVVIISPQSNTRLKSEINTKAKGLKADIVLPTKVKVSGKKIIATVSKSDLDPKPGWGYQLVMQSNEGYCGKAEILTRPVNQSRGDHRFGGGRDDNCDPHAIDILVPPAKGEKGEVDQQHKVLKKYGKGCKLVELPMVYR